MPPRDHDDKLDPDHLATISKETKNIFAERTREPRFKFIRIDELPPRTEPLFLVKGLIPKDSAVLIYGPPKAGKSFLALDLAAHIATGQPFFGHVTQQGPVLYLSCEGEAGLHLRLAALLEAHPTLKGDFAGQFLFAAVQIDLWRDAEALVDCVKKELGGITPAAVFIDTVNRSLAGSESSDSDMGNYIKGLDKVRRAFRCAVLLIHHCGHNLSRPRGHSSLSAAVDAQIAVRMKGPEHLTATVETMKDGEAGEKLHARLKVVPVQSVNSVATSCIVEQIIGPMQHRSSALPVDSTTALDVLRELLATRQLAAPRTAALSIPLTIWRNGCVTRWSASKNEYAAQKAFSRAKDTLLSNDIVVETGDRHYALASPNATDLRTMDPP